MKKIYLLTLVLVSLFSSCKKDNDTYYIRCTIDGTARTFNFGAYAHEETDNGFTSVGMGGFASSDTDGDWFGFYIDNVPGGDEIIAGTYTGTMTDFSVLGTFTDVAGGHDWEAGTSVEENAINYSVPVTNHFTIIIQSVDGNTIRGTFSGDFYVDADPREPKKPVTNGEFYLKFR